MEDFLSLLRFLGYLLPMLLVVPLAGWCNSMTRRGTWEYTLAWARSVAILVAIGLLLFAAIVPFTLPVEG